MSFVSKLPKNYTWWHERERIGILEFENDVSCGVSPTSASAGLKMRIFVNRRAADFTNDLTVVSELPPEFHEALAYKVISMGYTRGTSVNLQLAQYFEGLYQRAIKKGKRYAKQRKISTGHIKPIDF
tara:strand:- start:1512 stop:1892 length:381 start_codon:yes stop_codon:yes gene_type:complete